MTPARARTQTARALIIRLPRVQCNLLVTVEIKLRFQISPAQCGWDRNSHNLSYLGGFIFTAMSPGEYLELELAARLLIALVNVHVREGNVNCRHTPAKRKLHRQLISHACVTVTQRLKIVTKG